MKKFLTIAAVLSAIAIPLSAPLYAQNSVADTSGVERFAVYIGSNTGGKNNARLLYAGSDAISFQRTMTDIGGISPSNSRLLLDPTHDDIDTALKNISDLIESRRGKTKRTEFIFYYSGHSDEYALLLGKNKYDYSSLKAAITKVPSDVHVVILDSCYSGNFIRTKGGSRQKPFLVDDSSVVKGHAYLSSSSSQESSQESDEIGSSFFTNAMITGLRGAADSSGDKKVTLNELYSYAFNETLSKTENTSTGPQHPNYNITLVGSGDLVLSDISNSDCIVTLAKDLTGRIILRDKKGKLVSEVNKTSQAPLYLALEEGQYGVTVINDNSTLQGNFYLAPRRTHTVSYSDLSRVTRVANRTRGQADGSPAETLPASSGDTGIGGLSGFMSGLESDAAINNQTYIPMFFSILGNEFFFDSGKDFTTTFALGLFRAEVHSVNGIMLSNIANKACFVDGFAHAGIYNRIDEVRGVEGAGVFNISENLVGLQAAGLFNIAQDVYGMQGAGMFNMAHDVKYLECAGLFNSASGTLTGAQFAGAVNVAGQIAKGAQFSGIGNISKGEAHGAQFGTIFNSVKGDMHGAQFGLVNYCSGNCDFQFGLINISKNGVCELGAAYTMDKNLRLNFSSGMQYLYTVLGCELPAKTFIGQNDFFTVIYGLGTRISFSIMSVNFEVLGNQIHSEASPSGESLFYPALRGSFCVTPIKHLNIVVGASFAAEYGSNKGAFEYYKTDLSFGTDKVTIHPEFDFGARVSFN